METAAKAADPDVRVFAITPASMRALESCGVADGIMSTGRVSSYDRMQVWDALGPGHICFSTEDGAAVSPPLRAIARSLESAAAAAVRGSDASGADSLRLRRERRAVGASETSDGAGSGSASSAPAQLGFIAENGLLNGALFDELQRLDAAGKLQLLCPGKVKSIRAPPAGTTAGMLPSIRAGAGSGDSAAAPSPDQLASVTLEDGRVIRARLLVAADGAMSAVRGAAGIATWGWGYDQTAVVATVRTEAAHATAWQRFLPHGPVAVLPVSGVCKIECIEAECELPPADAGSTLLGAHKRRVSAQRSFLSAMQQGCSSFDPRICVLYNYPLSGDGAATSQCDKHGPAIHSSLLPSPLSPRLLCLCLRLLQLWDGLSSIVWSTSPDHAAALLAMTPPEFAAALNTVLHAPTEAFAAALTGSDPESAAAEARASMPSGDDAAAATTAGDDAAAAAAEQQRAYAASLFVPSRDRVFFDPLWALQRAAHAATGALARATASAGLSPAFMPPPRIAASVGGRASFPLRFQSANRYIAPRVALIG